MMSDINKQQVKQNREAIKPYWTKLREGETPLTMKLDRPSLYKEAKAGATIIELDAVFPHIAQKTFAEVVARRKSLRQYKDVPLTKEEVSYVLYETARVHSFTKTATFRTIPTGGATNAMETYVYVNNCTGIPEGLYHYLQDQHKLALIDDTNTISERVNEALFNQLRGTGIVIIMTAVPYRSEYKYSFCAHKMIAMEAGHAAQNASLAAEIIDSGACCLAAYNQDLLDHVLQVDGIEEFSTYAVTIGKR